jgi:hypothetical protein
MRSISKTEKIGARSLTKAVSPKITPPQVPRKSDRVPGISFQRGAVPRSWTRKNFNTLAAFKILKKCGFVERLLIIAPLRPCYSVWPAEVKKWGQFSGLSIGVLHGPRKQKVLNTKHDIYVINPEGLRWLFTTLRANMPFDMLVVDECFPLGTKIKTPTGHVEIQDIKVGDVVNNALGTGRVKRVGKRPTKNLVKLVTEKGVIISTPEHPFFTTMGWVYAKDCGGQEILDYETVSSLWGDIRSSSFEVGEGVKAGLLKILLQETDVGATSGAQRSCLEEDVKNTDRTFSLEQGNSLENGSRGETSPSSKEQQPTHGVLEAPKGEWDRSNTGRLSVESGNTVGETRSWVSNELQIAVEVDGASHNSMKRRALDAKKTEETGRTRVVCVENIEHGTEVNVWNIEVEGHPSYFAEGFLVHNCSKFKNTNTDRFKTLKPYLPRFKRRVILTGSPAPNSLLDIFGQMYILDLGKTLSPYITHFRSKFFNKRTFDVRHPNPQKAENGETLTVTDWYITPEKATVLYEHIAPSVLRMSAEDHLDIPPLIINDIYIDLPPKARLVYDQFESAMRLDFKAGKVTAANAAIRGMKARQIANGGIFLDDSGKAWEDIHFAKAEVVQGTGRGA